MVTIPSVADMLQSGVHFGHQVSRWHPKMKRFIFTERNGVHVINLEATTAELKTTLAAVTAMAAEGKQILFVTTKPQAKEIVKQAAIDCGMPYLVERWVGGLLTNFTEIKKLLKKYISLKEQQASGELERYTKKEQLDIARDLVKMDKTLAGLVSLKEMPSALFVPAVQREKTAITEANTMAVPIVGVCDTNANPDKVDFIIPANDDAVNSIKLITGLVRDAVNEGRKEWEKKKAMAGTAIKA
jgi:small subunit ribosomal protein S2